MDFGFSSCSWGGRSHAIMFAIQRPAILNELRKKSKASVNRGQKPAGVRLGELLVKTLPCAITRGSSVFSRADFAGPPTSVACVSA